MQKLTVNQSNPRNRLVSNLLLHFYSSDLRFNVFRSSWRDQNIWLVPLSVIRRVKAVARHDLVLPGRLLALCWSKPIHIYPVQLSDVMQQCIKGRPRRDVYLAHLLCEGCHLGPQQCTLRVMTHKYFLLQCSCFLIVAWLPFAHAVGRLSLV